ncbi:MAG: leucine-rich repeat domain-containing protein [Ruminococcus sp.]|uniref:leucine-rich repeat domain-containing protein n=1 Tax=Ruminococcus sp. TaxID=41978 RepID=UPI002600D69C|nr:leucine-rich repeat domain-containing protein [Ruminococcus sp.]MBO4867652.1 leucine-rich repeat domain-containing protein [Ruminococcus sp.]
MKKRIISIVSAAAAAVTLTFGTGILPTVCEVTPIKANASTYAYNNSYYVYDDFRYKFIDQDETVTIIKYTGKDEEVTIPAEINGYKVIEIEYEAFEKCKTITSVIIPEGVTYIGDSAFSGCEKLASVTIPKSVKVISSDAFENTAWLNEQRKADPLVIVNNILIDGRTASGDVVIPDTVKIIGSSSFYNNSELTSVSIPDSVIEIHGGAFFNCSSMRSITIPKNVSFIGWYAIGYYYDDSTTDEKLQKNFKVYCYAHSEGFTYAYSKKLNYDIIGCKAPIIYSETLPGAVMLQWTKASGVTQYGIAGYVNGKWKLLDTVPAGNFYTYPLPSLPSPYYVLKNLKYGTQYKVAVVGMVNGKWDPDFSNAVTVTPDAPHDLKEKAEVKGSKFKLTWTADKEAEGYAVAVFQNDRWKIVGKTSADKTSYISPDLPAGTYNVAVAAKINGRYDTTHIQDQPLEITIS